jgi:hypothetical protein
LFRSGNVNIPYSRVINRLRQYQINPLMNDKIQRGGYYILAPENGCAGSVDPNSFEAVWQYGSNLGEPNADPIWEQDGVAPQCAVQHINDNPAKGGRAFIPTDYARSRLPVLIPSTVSLATAMAVFYSQML